MVYSKNNSKILKKFLNNHSNFLTAIVTPRKLKPNDELIMVIDQINRTELVKYIL